jgi:hypothetical protein
LENAVFPGSRTKSIMYKLRRKVLGSIQNNLTRNSRNFAIKKQLKTAVDSGAKGRWKSIKNVLII